MLKIILTVTIVAIVVGSGVCFWPAPQTAQLARTPAEQSKQNTITPKKEEITTLTILVPKSIEEYEKAMTECVQTGKGSDPAETMLFIKKQVTVQKPIDDIVKASAEAAAGVITTGGGPSQASVVYLKIKNKTAYILLNIDVDGWAGVSVSLAKIHPIVEKTLLEFPEVDKVVFGVAPGDNRENITE